MSPQFQILSSNKTQTEEKVVEKTQTVPETRVPRLYKVILMNDDFTPMDFVVLILKKYFAKDDTQSVDIMLQVHEQGYAVAGTYQYDIAETNIHQVHSEAKAHEHPLRCRLEAE
jgi:ATP-dependent Clp protease adaptor protein ClpS